MIRNQQIDILSRLFLDIGKGFFIAAFAIQFLTKSDIILFWKYITIGVIAILCALKILEFKKEVIK